MRNALEAAGHLALWSGLYVTASLVCFAQTSGLWGYSRGSAFGHALLFAWALATAVYLLDRVKLWDAWLDPADAAAHPRRFHFLARRAMTVRGAVCVLLIASSWLGLGLARWAAALPAIAGVGVLAYAARPRAVRPRPKDLLLVKSLYVAAGISGFAALTVLASTNPGRMLRESLAAIGERPVPFVFALAHVLIRVFADAVLCDLDDERADREHGTDTLPGRLGRSRAWNIAMTTRLSLALALTIAAGLPLGLPTSELLWWAGVTAASSVLLRWSAPTKVRDWVDIRFALEAVVVTVAMELQSARWP